MRFRSLDESLAWMDHIFEARLREYQTALLIDIPARGVEMDSDVQAEQIEDQRRAWVTQRAEIRRTLLAWITSGDDARETEK